MISSFVLANQVLLGVLLFMGVICMIVEFAARTLTSVVVFIEFILRSL